MSDRIVNEGCSDWLILRNSKKLDVLLLGSLVVRLVMREMFPRRIFAVPTDRSAWPIDRSLNFVQRSKLPL